MLISVLDTFADAQAITATADSNTIDLGAAGRDLSMADDLYLEVLVETSFTAAGAATLDVDIKSSDDVAFGSGVTDIKLAASVGKATLVKGYVVYRGRVTGMVSRYNKITFTVGTGPMTAGAISAFLTNGLQTWRAGASPNQA